MIYNDVILKYFHQRQRVGKLENATITAEVKKAGRHIIFYVSLDNNVITNVSYKAYGSTVLIAGCAYIAEQLQAAHILDLGKLTHQGFAEFFEVSPAQLSNTFILEDVVKKIQEKANGNS
jgi:NifU-like protein involved in Fe-S cluster formation